jgi:hypothetical protein
VTTGQAWQLRALCRTLPADWWDVGDDGNRLALALCSACPVLDRCSAGRHHGVIRAGVAWSERGERAEICECGYPALGIGARCARCTVHDRTPLPRLVRLRRDAARKRAFRAREVAGSVQ